MMHKEASKTKKQDALKNDLQKASAPTSCTHPTQPHALPHTRRLQSPYHVQVIALVEKDTSGDKDASMDGRLKDVLPRMGRQARNDFFQGFLETDEMKKAQPVRRWPVLQLCP